MLDPSSIKACAERDGEVRQLAMVQVIFVALAAVANVPNVRIAGGVAPRGRALLRNASVDAARAERGSSPVA